MTDYAQYHARSKSLGAAIFLWILFGGLGAHRFYLKSALGVFYIVLQVCAFSFLFNGHPDVAVVLWGLLLCLGLFDFFWLFGSVSKYNQNIASELTPKTR